MPAPADAVAPSVSILKIATKKAPAHGTVTVAPSVAAKGNVQVLSKSLTVKKGRKTVATKRTSARLKAGKYKVTQQVTYRTFTNRIVNVVVFDQGDTFGGLNDFVNDCVVSSVNANNVDFSLRCSLSSFDADVNEHDWTVTTTGTYDADASQYTLDGGFQGYQSESLAVGDELSVLEIKLPVDLTVKKTQRFYGKSATKSLTQTLLVRKGPKARTCATYSDFANVSVDFDDPENYGDYISTVRTELHSAGRTTSFTDLGSSYLEWRDYKPCKKGASISIGFENDYAYAKSYSR